MTELVRGIRKRSVVEMIPYLKFHDGLARLMVNSSS